MTVCLICEVAMKNLKFFSFILACIVSVFFTFPVHARDLPGIKTAWLGEHEKFIVWYAQKHGWDEEHGFKLDVLNFDSGKSILDGMKAYGWGIAGMGAVPALTGYFNKEIKIIAIANNESNSNMLYVRNNSPLLRQKGYDPAYPDVYGSPELVRNAKILCAKGSSAHYLVDSWLKLFDLTEKDVKMQFMEMTPAFGAFKGGFGDIAGVWSPYVFEADKMGFQAIADGGTCNVFQPVLIVVNVEYAEKNPQLVTAFLKMYMQGIELLRTKPLEDLAPEYQTFFKEELNLDITRDEALFDLRNHPVFTLDEQKVMFNDKNQTSVVYDWLNEIVEFYKANNGVMTETNEKLNALDPTWINQIQ